MKTLLKILLLSGVVIFAIPAQAQTADCKVLKNGVVMRDNKLFTFDKNGVMVPVTEDIELSNGTKVSKNGEYKTSAGAKSKLKNGEILSSKGDMMVMEDNTVRIEGASMEDGEVVTSNSEVVLKKTDVFIMDGVTIRGGKAMKWDQGKYVPLVADMTLGTSGSKINAAGVVTNKNGSVVKLGEGTFINAKGEMAFSKNAALSDGVFMRDGKVFLLEKGKVAPLTTEYALTNGNKVTPQGVIVFASGEKLALNEGELVLPSGELVLLKVGKVEEKPVSDPKTAGYYIFRSGKIMVAKDGKETALKEEKLMPNWVRLYPDGTVEKNDVKTKMAEGDRFDMEGDPLPPINTGGATGTPKTTTPSKTPSTTTTTEAKAPKQTFVTFKGGKMVIMAGVKEITLSKERILNNGTKIGTDGTIVKGDGSSFKLKEGEKVDYNTGELVK
jgi:hypothetical protein